MRVIDAERVATLVDGAKRYASSTAPTPSAAADAGSTLSAGSSTALLASAGSSGTQSAVGSGFDVEAAVLKSDRRPTIPLPFQNPNQTKVLDWIRHHERFSLNGALGHTHDAADIRVGALLLISFGAFQVDTVFELLLAREPSPVQTIALEQLVPSLHTEPLRSDGSHIGVSCRRICAHPCHFSTLIQLHGLPLVLMF